MKRTGEDGFTHPRCYKLSGQPFLSTCVVVEYLTKMDDRSVYQSNATLKCLMSRQDMQINKLSRGCVQGGHNSLTQTCTT